MRRTGAVMGLTRVAGACFGLLVIAAVIAPSASAVSRRQANRLALRALNPRAGVVVFGLPAPVAAGSTFLQEGPGAFAVGRATVQHRGGDERLVWRTRPGRVKHRAWLYWEDLVPGALFAHPSVLLLLDARSGRVVLRKTLGWAPLMNGRRPAFLRSVAAYGGSRYRVFSQRRARAASVFGGLSFKPALASNLNLGGVCLAAVGATDEPLVKPDFAALQGLAKGLGLPLLVAQSPGELGLALANPRRNCQHVSLFVLGHGIPPADSSADGGVPNLLYSKFIPDPCVLLNKAGGMSSEPGKFGVHLLCAADLKGIIAAHPNVRFDVQILSCYAGRWLPPLSDVSNVASVGVSSGPTKYSYGGPNGAASDFTRAVVDGVLSWAKNPQAVNDTGGSITGALEAADDDYDRTHLDREPEYYDSVRGEIVGYDTKHPDGQEVPAHGGGQPNPNNPSGPSPAPTPLPPSRIPHGTVTLNQTWTLSQPPPPGVQHTITATCTATLTYDGTRTVKVDESYSWKEQVSQNGRTTTTTRTGQFHNTGQSDGAPLTFSRGVFGNFTYSFSVFTAQDLMPVDETIVSTSPPQNYHNTYQSSCWNEDPTRSTPTTVSGNASSSGHAADSLDQTVDGSQYRAHHVLSWALDP